jgi:hypothetical protein
MFSRGGSFGTAAVFFGEDEMQFVRCAIYSLILVGPLLLAGCGEKVETVTPPAAPTLKQELDRIAASGEPVGSAGQMLLDEVTKLKAQDPAKGATIEKQVIELNSLQDPSEIKAKAAAISASL